MYVCVVYKLYTTNVRLFQRRRKKVVADDDDDGDKNTNYFSYINIVRQEYENLNFYGILIYI